MSESDMYSEEPYRRDPCEENTASSFASLPGWARYGIAGMIVLPAVEFMLIVGLIFWRILFGIYEADIVLFAEIINTFGSSFVNSVAFGAGAGGVFGLARGLPKILAKFKS